MQTKMQTNQHTAEIYPLYRGAPPPLPYEPAFEDDTDYPESDGQPMAETELNRDLMIDSLLTLKARFQDIPDVCVSGNMFMYYVPGDAKQSVSPDVFVTFGIERKQRRIYRLWEEGKPPDFVLEFSSENTFKKDLGPKKKLYAERLGVREYFLYDAERKYLPTPLMGFRLVGTEYVPIRPASDGKVFAETLGLFLGLHGDGFGFYDAIAGRWLETPMDEAAERAAAAATVAERAEAAAHRAKEEAAQAVLAQQRTEALVQEAAAHMQEVEAVVQAETAARQRAEVLAQEAAAVARAEADARQHAEAAAEEKRVEAEQADARADRAEEELAELQAAYRQLQIELNRQKSSDES